MRFDTKEEADGLRTLEVWWLKKQGYLSGWKSGTVTWTYRNSGKENSITLIGDIITETPYIRLRYTLFNNYGDEVEKINYVVPITTTPCHLGGERQWFVCPGNVNGSVCRRRVAKLYFLNRYFLCRHCHNLTYESRNQNRRSSFEGYRLLFDAQQKIQEIRESMTTPFYAGKPTKKMKRIQKLLDRTASMGGLPDIRDLL